MSRIAAFGEVMMRMQVPGYDMLAQSDTLKYTFSGSGVNVTAGLARLGHEGVVITTLPATPVGEAALAYLRKLGIDTVYINRGGKHLGMYFLENGFGCRSSRVTYTDRLGSSFNTSALDSYDFGAAASEIDALHLCGITLAMNDTVRAQMKLLAAEVKKKGGTVIFDCNYRPGLWGAEGYAKARPHYEDMLGLADIVLMNEKDARLILGMDAGDGDRVSQLQRAIPLVAERFRIRTAAGTHREINGDNTHSLTGYIYRDGAFSFSDKLSFSVHDRIGAGDAFAGVIIHGELSGYPVQRTVSYAAAAAMLAHTVTGDTAQFTEEELKAAAADAVQDVIR